MAEDKEKHESQAVMQQPTNVPMALPSEAFSGTTLERAKEKIDIMNQLKLIAVRSTNETNWVDLGGNPYLTEAGCMKFADVYGVSFKDIRITPSNYTDEVGPVMAYIAEVTAVFQNRQDTETGMATSADKFFERDGKRQPLSEVRIPDVMKKAITNAKARATKKILGLSFTWEEVRDALSAAGRDPGKVASVSYGGKSGKRNVTSGKGKKTQKKTEIANMIFEMCQGDEEDSRNMLYNYTKFVDNNGKEHGVYNVLELSDKWANSTYRKVKKDYDVYKEQEGGEE